MKRIMFVTAAISVFIFGAIAFANDNTDLCNNNVICANALKASNDYNVLQEGLRFVWRPGHYKTSKKSKRGRSRSFFSRISVPQTGPANANGTFVFNPRKLTWAAYNSGGNLVRSGHAVGGNDYCPDLGRSCHTPVGRFRVYARGPENCVSRKYPLGKGGAKMPYCMYFLGGYAIHGSHDVPHFNASHGCIRLYPHMAKWLYKNFLRIGTVVVVRPY